MLRTGYLERFKTNPTSTYPLCAKDEDDDFMVSNIRPIAPRSIRQLSPQELNNFVEDIMTNKQVTKVLYSNNAKNEINKYIKEKKNVTRNKSFSKTKKTLKRVNTTEPSDIVKKRARKETFNQIQQEVTLFKNSEKLKNETIRNKNYIFYRTIKKESENEKNPLKDGLTKHKINSFKTIFNSVREKMLIGKAIESINKNGGSAVVTAPEGEVTSQLNNSNNLLNMSIASNLPTHQPKLPSMKLDMKDVYSRLYHNAVYLNPSSSNSTKNIRARNGLPLQSPLTSKNDTYSFKRKNPSMPRLLTASGTAGRRRTTRRRMSTHFPVENEDEFNTHIKHKKPLKIKNALPYNGGKEFTIKVTDNMINDCFCKYSGGPSIFKNRKNSESIVNSNGINYYNIKNHQGNSLLHVVTLDELPEMGRYIIEKGGNINGKNKDGDTPLHLAVRNKKKLMIDVLMNNGAKIDIENAKRETVYELATNDLRKKYNMTKTIIATQNKKKKK